MYKIYIQPRCSGKTSDLIKIFMETDQVLFLLPTHNSCNDIKRKFNHNFYDDIMVLDKNIIEHIIHRQDYKHLLVDEYFFYSQKMKDIFHQIINTFQFESVIIKATSDRLYDKNALNIIRKIRKHKIPFNLIDKRWLDEFSDECNSILSDPRFEIINLYDDHLNFLPDDKFETEILGRVYR